MSFAFALCLLLGAPPSPAPVVPADAPRNAVRDWKSAEATTTARLERIATCGREVIGLGAQRRYISYLETTIGTHVLAVVAFEDHDFSKQAVDIPPSPGVCVGIDGKTVEGVRESDRAVSYLPALLALTPTTRREISDFLEAVVMTEGGASRPLVTPEEIAALAARQPIAAKLLGGSEVGLARDGRKLRGWYEVSCRGLCTPRFGLARFEITLSEDHHKVTFPPVLVYASEPGEGWQAFPR